jgi:hypothetical protein
MKNIFVQCVMLIFVKNVLKKKKIEEFIGETKSQNGVYKYNHKCNPESIESFKLICKETKPCPNCRTRISKVSGCDQMWCTQCHVTFSWTTGLKVTGNIHNPHYYEWKKNNEEMATFRNVGEILCGGIPDLTYLSNMFRRTETLKGNLEVIMRYNTNHEKMSAFGSFTLDELVNTPNIIYYESSIRHLYIPIFSGDMLPTFKESKNSKQDMFMTSIYESCENSYLKVFYCAVFRQLLFLDNLLKMHRAVSHFENYELHYLRIAVRDIDRKDEELRIKFIMKEIDEKHYKMLIMKKNNKKQKLIKMLHVFEMCYVTILETFNDIVATIYEIIEKHEEYISSYTNNISNLAFESRDDWYNLIYKKWQQHTVVNKKEKILNNYYRLGKIINYCNKELWKISKLYNQNVAFIDYGCQTRDEKFERHGYLNTLSIRWDDPVFQLKKETITKNYKKKVLNVKGKEQDEHFNKCWLFNNNTNDVAYSKYGGIKNDRVIYHYSFIVTVQELLDHSKKEKFRYSGFNKSDMFYLYAKYGAGSSLFA